MDANDGELDELIAGAGRGDSAARQRLLDRHRARLRRMVAVRLDPRLSPRIDASDVVQEALVDADRELDAYLRRPVMPFYLWLRQLVWDRLLRLYRFHVVAQRRSIEREAGAFPPLTDDSVGELAVRLVGSGTSPSRRMIREELRASVRSALDAMPSRDREILVQRYLEQLSFEEIASVLGIGVGAVKMRHLRALTRLRDRLAELGES